MMYQWISWIQPTEDYRPITFPPSENILGWWCTGERTDGAATLVAMVKANNEGAAKNIVRTDWPEVEEWRFCERKPTLELGDRFPLNDWMNERFEQEKNND